jgi:hypothetical protein
MLAEANREIRLALDTANFVAASNRSRYRSVFRFARTGAVGTKEIAP